MNISWFVEHFARVCVPRAQLITFTVRKLSLLSDVLYQQLTYQCIVLCVTINLRISEEYMYVTAMSDGHRI